MTGPINLTLRRLPSPTRIQQPAPAGTELAVASSNQLLVGLYRPDLHVVLDTVGACVAALVATLLLTRARTRGRLADQLLGEALLIFAPV